MFHTLLHSFTAPGWTTLLLLLIVLVMLVSNRVRIDLIALCIFLTLGGTRILKEEDLFAGLGSEAVTVIAAMLAIGSALVGSGVTDVMAAWISRVAGKTEQRLSPLLMVVGGVLSSFISDLAIVSIFLSVILGFEKRLGVSARRLLLPFAIASMLGGLITMVGGATNIVANEIVAKSGLAPLPLFAIAPLGLTLLVAGILFMWLIGRFLLPPAVRESSGAKSVIGIPEYLTEMLIPEGSAWIGKMLKDVPFFKENGIDVIRILRKKPVLRPRAHTMLRQNPVPFPRATTVLREGDILLVQAHADDLLKLRSTTHFLVQQEVHKSLAEASVAMAGEAIIRQGSEFIGQTLTGLNFRKRFNVTVLALWRNGQAITQRLASIPLRAGDMLLLSGPREKIDEIADDEGLLMISQRSHVPQTVKKRVLALGILALVFLLASFKVLPMSIAGVLGVLLMVLFGVTSLRRAYHAVEWPILLFVAAMFALGSAMKETGIIDLISKQIVHLVGSHGPYALLAVAFLLAAAVTQVLSNTATTLLLTPVMISAATALHLNPIPFVVAVIVGVTASPITYVSHKVFLIIMGPGGYKYFDYVRFGLPLTVLFFGITMAMVPWLFPFA